MAQRDATLAAALPRRDRAQRARELVEFARHHCYRIDERVEITENVG
jgi:hypothetical protein